MSADLEFEPFVVDERPPTAPTGRGPTPPWRWGVAGLVIGLVAGYAATVEVPEPDIGALPDLTVPGRSLGPVDDTSPTVESLSAAGVAGFVELLVEFSDGAGMVRLHGNRPDALFLGPLDPSALPSGDGAWAGRVLDHRDGSVLEITPTAIAPAGTPGLVRLGERVRSWSWDDQTPDLVAWAEEPRAGMTAVSRARVATAATGEIETMLLLGSWEVVHVSEGTLVVVEDGAGALGLTSFTGSFYQRTAEAPVVVTGTIDGVVHAVTGPGRLPLVTDLRGTAAPWPVDWWRPSLGWALAAPTGTGERGWAMQEGEAAVVLTAPDGVRRVVPATGAGAWSGDGRFALIPQGTALLVVDTARATAARVEVGAPIRRIWSTVGATG